LKYSVTICLKKKIILSLFLFSLPGEFKHIINRRKRKKIWFD